MDAEKSIEIPGIGPAIIVKSSKARNISIAIKAFHPVKVTVPGYASFAEGERFLELKRAWLIKTLSKKNKLEQGFTVFQKDTPFSTRKHQLLMHPEDRKNINIKVADGIIKISYPAHVDPKHELIQSCVRKGIEEAWRIEAGRYLPKRLLELAQQHGFSFRKINIRNSKTHWGSCSSDNSIALSLHLIRLPQNLIDYVLLHELVHTIHKNHSPRFHNALENILPGEATLSKELAKFSISIY